MALERSHPPEVIHRKSSTGTATLHFTSEVLKNMDTCRLTAAFFLGLEKAFDSVDHELLIMKMMSIGITGQPVD